jgi:hypothetical protein
MTPVACAQCHKREQHRECQRCPARRDQYDGIRNAKPVCAHHDCDEGQHSGQTKQLPRHHGRSHESLSPCWLYTDQQRNLREITRRIGRCDKHRTRRQRSRVPARSGPTPHPDTSCQLSPNPRKRRRPDLCRHRCRRRQSRQAHRSSRTRRKIQGWNLGALRCSQRTLPPRRRDARDAPSDDRTCTPDDNRAQRRATHHVV